MDKNQVFPGQISCALEALKSFFTLSQNALFLASQQKQEFLFYNSHFKALFSDDTSAETIISFDLLFQMVHDDDRHLLEKLLTSPDPMFFNPEGENIRFVTKHLTSKVYNVRCGKMIFI